MPPIRLLEIGGTPYEMGYQHGSAYAAAIRELAAERLRLSGDETWAGRALPRERLLALAETCLEAHYDYAPELMMQLEGMADATGLGLPELIITNGFTDFIDMVYNAGEAEPGTITMPLRASNECTAFIIGKEATQSDAAFLGQTWDMHETAMPYVILLRGRPENGPAFLAFTLTGCLAMIGMNEAGIAVGISNLASVDGQAGVTWPFVCRKILAQATIEEALACITSARLAGGHSYLIADDAGRGYNVEAMPTVHHIRELNGDVLVHTNQCLAHATHQVERPLADEWVEDSGTRYNRALSLLEDRPVTVGQLMRLTRDRRDGPYSICSMSEPPFYSQTCGAVIMNTATRDFWCVWGLPTENAYEHFVV